MQTDGEKKLTKVYEFTFALLYVIPFSILTILFLLGTAIRVLTFCFE